MQAGRLTEQEPRDREGSLDIRKLPTIEKYISQKRMRWVGPLGLELADPHTDESAGDDLI